MAIENWPQQVPRVAVVVSVFLLAACAANLTEDQRIALEYDRVERQASIQEFVASCESGGQTVVYTGPTYHKLRDPVKHVPRHARLRDYACASQQALNREFGFGS